MCTKINQLELSDKSQAINAASRFIFILNTMCVENYLVIQLQWQVYDS